MTKGKHMKNKRLQLNEKQKTYLNNLIEYYDLEKDFHKFNPLILEALWIMSDDEAVNDSLNDLVNEFFISKGLEETR
jgi:Flp pilus assembly protein TadD